MKAVFLVCAVLMIISVLLICVFLFSSGIPAIAEIGPLKFLTGTRWRPSGGIYGVFPMIVGSIYVTAGAIAIGAPIGLLTAIYLARFCPKKLYGVLDPVVSLMAGIPSVLYGFFALMVIVPIFRQAFDAGKSIVTASVLLSVMILPTIIRVSESAIRAVPETYYEGALALGATHERGVFGVVVPSARSGILAALVLGIGRAIGETMAVVMVAGNQAILPESITDGVRTLTANIVLEMGYAEGMHRGALIGTAVVLFVFILIINLLLQSVKGRKQNG